MKFTRNHLKIILALGAVAVILQACKGKLKMPQEVRKEFQDGKTITIGIIGNSVGCGAASDGNERGSRNGPYVTDDSENDPTIGAWANQLQVWLKARNPASIVWNRSAGGFTVADHLAQGTVLMLASKEPRPELVFIPLQINEDRQHMPMADFVRQTTLLAQQAASAGMTPVLVLENKEPSSTFESYVAAVDNLANDPKWMRILGQPLDVMDTYSNFDLTSMLSPDNVHPNQAGHDEILAAYKNWFLK